MALLHPAPSFAWDVRVLVVRWWVLASVRLSGTRREAGGALTEEALVEAARGGERWAFTALYERHVDGVWKRLTRLLGADAEREDLTQHVFFEAFRGLDRFRGESAFGTYLYRIATNAACDHLRRRSRGGANAPVPEEVLASLPATGGTPEAVAARRQALAMTWSLLDRIKPKKRVAYVLRVVEGLSLEEVAAQVDSNVPTVAQRVRHAHEELMAMLERRGWTPGEDGEDA